jgi:hypothetical protein
MELNGFFSLNTISVICKKIPMLAPMEKIFMDALKSLKVLFFPAVLTQALNPAIIFR